VAEDAVIKKKAGSDSDSDDEENENDLKDKGVSNKKKKV
jgi:splicing factor 3B subunit 2